MVSMDLEWLFPSSSSSSSSAALVFCTVVALLGGFMGYLYGPYWKVKKVPGPTPVPLVGHLPLLAKYGFGVFSSLARQYGPIYRFHMGRQPLIIIADAELCKEVGIKKFKDIPNRSVPSSISSTTIHQKSLFFSKDTQWSTMRNAILSFYQPTYISSLLPTMQSFIESATQNLDSQEEINFSKLSLLLATDLVGQTTFGINFGLSRTYSASDDDDDDSIKNPGTIDEVSEFINQHIYNSTNDLSSSLSIIVGQLVPILQMPFKQILKRIPGTMDRKIERSNRKLSSYLEKIVEKRMEDKARTTSRDFLSLVIDSRESKTISEKVLTPDYISAITYEQLFAGTITTSFTLSSVVYLVAGHPEVEEKMLQEIDGFGMKDQIPTSQDLQDNFPYLDQVMKESMRFYTVSPLVARETSSDVEIGGYLLPKGTWVWLALEVLAKDPRNFSEPEKFKPERFNPECEEMKRRHPYAFLPFGIGPRICIGQKYSLQMLKLALVHLYRNYVFRHSPTMENPIELDYAILLNFKHGVRVRAIKRTQRVVANDL